MGQLALSGTLSAGPPAGAETFPGSQLQVPLLLLAGASTTYGVASGILTQNVSSPAAYVALTGVGATAAVTQGLFLYLKTSDAMLLEVTQDDGAGGTTTVVLPVRGLLIVEFPTNKPLEALRIEGSGRIEYIVAGQT